MVDDAVCQCPRFAVGVDEPNESMIEVDAVEIILDEHPGLTLPKNPAVELAFMNIGVDDPAGSPDIADP